jgi:ribonuclease HII
MAGDVWVALIVGIDEAGFGPVLGPLVVTGVVVVVPDQQATTCLWDLLRET